MNSVSRPLFRSIAFLVVFLFSFNFIFAGTASAATAGSQQIVQKQKLIKDGANGLLQMKNAGAYTIGQDEKSCVVYGMPKEAASVGAVMKVVPLEKIPQVLLDLFRFE